jgi:hypothetical protein
MDRRMLRLGALGAAMTALLALGAATATASTSMAPSLRMRAHALERARTLPHGFFSFSTVFMQTAPVAVVRNGVTYNMILSVSADPGFGSTLDVSLERAQSTGLAFQEHDYSFSPQSGITFRYDKKTLETATLDTTTAIEPSQISGAFTATSVKSHTCRLYDGRMGSRLVAKGTLAFDAFDVVTPTAPFFGTIHTQPVNATIIRDPGCSSGIVVVFNTANAVRAIPKVGSALAGPAPHERYVEPCFLNRALGAKVGAGRFFGFEKGYRIPEIFQYAFRTKQVPPDERASSFIEALAGRSTLPKPVKVRPGRFEAAIHSAGGEFLTGSATFTSGPPTVRTGLSCRSGGRLRHYTRLTYSGTLEPGSTPLLAAFDTLPLSLREGTPATYVVRDYGRN